MYLFQIKINKKKQNKDLELQLIPKMNNSTNNEQKNTSNLQESLMNKNSTQRQDCLMSFSEHPSQENDLKDEIQNNQTLCQQFIQKFTFLVNTPNQQMNIRSIIQKDDPYRLFYTNIFDEFKKAPNTRSYMSAGQLQLNFRQSRLVAVMVGLGIGDALGSSTEFARYKKKGYEIFQDKNLKSFQAMQKAVKEKIISPKFKKYANHWTDDTSMALCMAYSLINPPQGFKPNYARKLYHLWWEKGLCNGGLPHSIGLGGNISKSFNQFKTKPQSRYVKKGKQNNNGNGSLMRLAPIPLFYHQDVDKAMKISSLQSRTTHNGFQAQQCCRLLTAIILNLINRKENNNDWRKIIEQTGNQFMSISKQVECLATGKQQQQKLFDDKIKKDRNYSDFNHDLRDRNWNWKQSEFDYSPNRLKINNQYIGSYCMDGLAMALHIVWTTNSFRECVQKAADMGGDADTIGAIAGQIAGAIYGFDKQVFQLYSQMADFQSSRYELFLVSLKLIKFRFIQQKTMPPQQNKVPQQTMPPQQNKIPHQQKNFWIKFFWCCYRSDSVDDN